MYPVGGRFTVKVGFQPKRLARGLEVGSIPRIQGIGYGVLEFLGARIRRIFLDGYGVLVFRIVIFKISSFKLQNAHLLLIFTKRYLMSSDTYDDLFDYLQQFEKLVNASRAKKLEKSHDPLALVAHTGSSSIITSPYYVTHPFSVVDYDEDYQGDALQNNYEDPLTCTMILLARSITQCFFNPTNNRLRTSSNTKNQAIVQGHYARNCPKPRVRDSKYFMEQMLLAKQDEAGVTFIDEQNEVLFDDASRMKEIEELSANICFMARIQPANFDSDARPSYDSAFLSEVQTPSTSYVNPVFAKDKQEQKYLKQPKIINNTIGDDQIDINIIFDEPNEDVNGGSVEYDNNVQESYELEQLARNTYKEAEKQQIIAKKVQQQNTVLTKQLESYKEKLLLALEDHRIEIHHSRILSYPTLKIHQRHVASKNVVSNKKIVTDVDVKNALKAKDVLCVSYAKNVLILCHDKCLAKYKLNVHSKVRRALFTTPRTVKSMFEDTTPVVSKTRFSVTPTQSKSLDTTHVVFKPKIAAVTTLSAKNKIFDSGCSKHMTGDRSLLKNFIEKFMGIVRFRNDHFATITGYSDFVQGNITVCHVYYVEGLGHNLFSVGQFCDDMAASLLVGLLSKATSTKSWLWHRRLSHLNFGTINDLTKHNLVDGILKFKYSKDHLYSICEWGKSKKSSHPPKFVLKTSRGFRIYNRRTKKIIETIHVKFDELTSMASEHDSLEPVSQRFIHDDSSTESMNTPSKEDLDNLFGPMYEEYFEKRSSEVSINSAAQQVHNYEDSPLTSSIIIEEHGDPPIVTTSDEQTSLISINEADELNQEDSVDFDGNIIFVPYDAPNFEDGESSTTTLDPSNMHEFHQVQPSTHIWTKEHPLEQVIGDPSKPVMTQNRLQSDFKLCMYALTISTLEPKNIKESMSDQSWI
ncbi:integrase, catalytic region, zinc finger, CCHC-type containing protein [Tanacetum coccineum]